MIQPHEPAEKPLGSKSHHAGKYEEEDNLCQNQQNTLLAAGQTADNSQCNQPKYIVYQRRRQNGIAHLRIQLSHFLERFHRNADRSRRQHSSHKHIFQKSAALNHAGDVGNPGKACSHHQGHYYTQQGHQKTGLAAVFQILNVRSHTG